MSRWTHEQSSLLSNLVDEVVGTQEIIETRQDACKLIDCVQSGADSGNKYFTGSKAEGLDLPGSDKDYMQDINSWCNLKVVQAKHEIDDTMPCNVFQMCTEDGLPGFALLQCVKECMYPRSIVMSLCHNLHGARYLSSDMLAQLFKECFNRFSRPGTKNNRQGPSVERWDEYDDKSESGTDNVPSIRCAFWPNCALEWAQRPRHLGWPSSHDVLSIIDFGCHLVPIGHPHSEKKIDRMAHFVLNSRKGISVVVQSHSNTMLCSDENYFKRIHQGKMQRKELCLVLLFHQNIPILDI